jgi:ABC-2 type transport system permease protein
MPQPQVLVEDLLTDHCGAGIIIPADFSQQLLRTHKAEFQVILNGVDAFTAKLARGYFQLLAAHAIPGQNVAGIVQSQVCIAFNSGLISAWYFVPGVLGAVITLSGTLVSSAAMLRERESGTLEQLIMLPVSSAEIVVAKALPIFALLFLDLCIAIGLTTWLFALPFRGNVLLFLFCSALYILICVGTGTLMATFCNSQRQAQLLSFFINIPVILLSGSLVPLETMPSILQTISLADALRYYQTLSRGIILKGLGPIEQSTEILCLLGFCLLLLLANLVRFRRQLS